MKIFVYGSLLRGERYHHHLAGATWLGEAQTEAAYTLVDLGEYPALLDGGETSVAGEVYEVDDALLAALDAFEGHPDEYRRMPVPLLGIGRVDAYVRPRAMSPGAPIVVSGNWRRR
jgi:gamma-glutamylaminecyclotransferase